MSGNKKFRAALGVIFLLAGSAMVAQQSAVHRVIEAIPCGIWPAIICRTVSPGR